MGEDLQSLDDIVERAVEQPDGFLCEREGIGHRLELWGRLPADWAGNLGLHLFAAGVHVTAGDAIRTREAGWRARAPPADHRRASPAGTRFETAYQLQV